MQSSFGGEPLLLTGSNQRGRFSFISATRWLLEEISQDIDVDFSLFRPVLFIGCGIAKRKLFRIVIHVPPSGDLGACAVEDVLRVIQPRGTGNTLLTHEYTFAWVSDPVFLFVSFDFSAGSVI
jgi:hypothetical protein